MILYNVTIKVDAAIATKWLAWLKAEHIPEMMHTGCFTKHNILRLLEVEDSDGPTFAIQYFLESKSLYTLYIEKFSNSMRQKSFELWSDKFLAFRSVMEFVN